MISNILHRYHNKKILNQQKVYWRYHPSEPGPELDSGSNDFRIQDLTISGSQEMLK
jgi:hypothetical protein